MQVEVYQFLATLDCYSEVELVGPQKSMEH